jgi:hypothetical protein
MLINTYRISRIHLAGQYLFKRLFVAILFVYTNEKDKACLMHMVRTYPYCTLSKQYCYLYIYILQTTIKVLLA